MNLLPLLSVIIPSYQHSNVVRSAIDSALAQTYPSKEIIVVDDGSDVPVEVPDGVTLIRHPINRGLSAALNTGIKASHGERFVILAADDRLSPRHLEYTSKQNADVVSVDMLVNGQRIVTKPATLEDLKTGNCHSYAALIRRSVFDKTAGFRETMNPSWEDYEEFCQLAEVGATWAHVHEALHMYNRTNTGRDAQAQGKDRLLWGKLQGYHQQMYGKGKGFVTFVVPVYKHEKFVAQSVRSALTQAYPHTNVVVVDDGSPGDVPGALVELGDTDGRLVVLRQKNGGLSAARNSGAKYALDYLNSQYLVMLDADDEVDANFVEDTMTVMGEREFVYTDLKFIGDAWHSYELEEYDCERLTKKHLHACTFLMQADMFREIRDARGYGYDEEMRSGWEDWEFSLACVENSWCGKRLPKELFHYRFHQGGSMRTAAQKKQDKLSKYIYGKHPWMLDERQMKMACKSCGGGGRFTSAARAAGKSAQRGMVFVPGFGDMPSDEQLLVRYTGPTTSTITKVGIGGTIYKYSANPEKVKTGQGPVFSIFAKDAHLFQGPYEMKRSTPEAVVSNATTIQVQAAPVTPQTVLPGNMKVIEIVPEPGPPKRIETVIEETFFMPEEKPEETTSGDDFTVLEGVSKQKHNKLVEAGFYSFRDVAKADVRELANVLNVSKVRAQLVIDGAKERA